MRLTRKLKKQMKKRRKNWGERGGKSLEGQPQAEHVLSLFLAISAPLRTSLSSLVRSIAALLGTKCNLSHTSYKFNGFL